jgi:hypothetical protein
MTDDPLERLRRICLALPEASERLSHGEPAWFVGGKRSFATYADHHHDDRVAFWCAATPEVQQALVSGNPLRYFIPPYVGVRGWVGVVLDPVTDWDSVTDLIEDAYRQVAPRRLVTDLDASPPPEP